jgi:23S rRNA pseudouridine1911/1915/1917 synthase
VAETSPAKVFPVPQTAVGTRLDQWLVSQLPDVSRVRIQQLIEQKKILINGKSPKPSMKLRGGEEIVITGQVELPPLKAFAEDIPLDVVYEDESIAIVNKPASMSVHAGSGKGEAGNRGTMVNALLHRFNQLSEIGGALRPGIVHRLDKETSGLVVVAKSDLAHRKLAEQFSRREVKKTYIALVHGWPKMTKGTINAAISRDVVRRARMTTRRASASRPGREAVTHWQVTDTLYGGPSRISRPQSYGGTAPEVASLKRNFLHAFAIQFRHPISERPLSFQQPLPAELSDFLRQIGD